MKKFELKNETKEMNGRTFHRIVALVDIPDLSVLKGHNGGWLESEDCLSHRGNCWVKDDAMVEEGSNVTGNAVVAENAYIGNQSYISLDAIVDGHANISDSTINGKAFIGGSAHVRTSTIFGRVTIKGESAVKDCRISSEVMIDGSASIQDSELVGLERSEISGQAKVKKLTITSSNPVKDLYIHGNSEIDDVSISGLRIVIRDDASISRSTIDGKDIRLCGFSRIERGVTLFDNCIIGGFTTISLDGWGNVLKNISLDTDDKITMDNYHLLR